MSLVFSCIGTDLCKQMRVFRHFLKSTRLSSCKFWNLAKNCRFYNICKISAEISRKLLLIFQIDFLLKFWDCSGAKVCKSCRAWKMLPNAYFLAKFRFDTAENEPAKKFQTFARRLFKNRWFNKHSSAPCASMRALPTCTPIERRAGTPAIASASTSPRLSSSQPPRFVRQT